MIFTFLFFFFHTTCTDAHTYEVVLPEFRGKMFQNEAKNKLKTPLHMVFSILPNQPVRNQWNYQEKMERHFSVETKFSIEPSDPFTFRPKV